MSHDAARPLVDKLYFLAFYKHDAPQCLVAGPWVDPEDATLARVFHEIGDQLCVVNTEMSFFLERAYDDRPL